MFKTVRTIAVRKTAFVILYLLAFPLYTTENSPPTIKPTVIIVTSAVDSCPSAAEEIVNSDEDFFQNSADAPEKSTPTRKEIFKDFTQHALAVAYVKYLGAKDLAITAYQKMLALFKHDVKTKTTQKVTSHAESR
jgi:hypothetical protein